MEKSIRVQIKKQFDRVAYKYGWLNKFLRNFNRLISPVTPFRIRVAGVLNLTFNHELQFKMATNETSAVSKKIFWNGPENYEYSAIFEKLARKCSAFADIGANIGYYSLLAAKANPSIKVYAFEPAAGPFHFLERNVAINQLESQIGIYAIALSNSSGAIEFKEIQNHDKKRIRHNLGGAGKILKENDSRLNIIPIMVPCETTDIFFRDFSPLPDLIKMDTEGTENMVIEGGLKLIQSQKPIIICETLFNVIEKDLDEIMRKEGYHFYNHVRGKLVQVETIMRETDNGVSDCFFVHPDKEHLIHEFV